MNLKDVAAEIAAQVDTIAGLRCFGFVPDSITPPAAMVLYPEDITFDASYKRGADRMNGQLLVVVGRVADRKTLDLLGVYADGSGAKSIKQVIEARTGSWVACNDVTVVSVVFEPVEIGGAPYMAAVFTLKIAGKGA